jgi:hypothetical protein
MPAKDVLSKIGADYIAATPEASAEKVLAFCAYASKWLLDRGVVGLGHTDNGMALRFADGEELPLFSHAPMPAELPTAKGVFSITGMSGSKITAPTPNNAPDFQITGR